MNKTEDIISRKPAWPLYRKLTALVLVLTCLGVVIVAKATFIFTGQEHSNPYFLLKKEILWAMFGFIAFLFAQKINLNVLRRFSQSIILTAVVFLVMVLIFGRECGLFGSIFFIAFFFFLVHWGIQTAKRSTDRFRSLLATGIIALIGLQAIFHVGLVIGLFPTKGHVLPFIGYGGSSLIITLFAAGLLVNIARDLPKEDFKL